MRILLSGPLLVTCFVVRHQQIRIARKNLFPSGFLRRIVSVPIAHDGLRVWGCDSHSEELALHRPAEKGTQPRMPKPWSMSFGVALALVMLHHSTGATSLARFP